MFKLHVMNNPVFKPTTFIRCYIEENMHLLARVLNLKSTVSHQMLQASKVLACFPILALNIFKKDLEQQHILINHTHTHIIYCIQNKRNTIIPLAKAISIQSWTRDNI